ncbi:hypothetical protein OF829_07220 [Sphingomonas sp. LB-2]|uniref:hypothetical protein n=1 Tax=Sphingomonas caeni TaxID=2984949 RepID=UPI00222E4C8E|nr:hypothetical protein [Sphingomonas caeni]MCW3847026.1 hypothetical protein [Sphingomonas caeni]
MSRKFSTARREAFFRALAETGNQTLAAERAKVSRSWVTLHRAADPEFRARIAAARAEAKARIARAKAEGGGVAPPSGWGSLDGAELVVRGGNGRWTQIARARLKQWSPRVEARFLGVLAATCNVKAACTAVGLTAASAYAHAKRWQGFAERWREAVEIGYLRIEAGLLAQADGNPFSDREVDPEVAMPPMTVAQALQLLHMHKREVRGIGGRPGVSGPPPSFEAVKPGILRKLERFQASIEARGLVDPETQAADAREWARRR